MASTVSLAFEILARDRASKELEKVGKGVDETRGRIGHLGTAGKVAMASFGAAVAAFGKKSVDSYQEVGKETLRLQRYIGGSAESASRLRFAAEESGVGIDSLTKGLGILSKHLGANDSAARSLGVAFRDAHGNIMPMDELLPKIAQKFAVMPNGPGKTAAVLKTFGKAGMDLLPFLNKGAKGIEELTKQSDSLGNTLSGKDLQAVKDNTKAKREWNAAVMGVQIQLGRYLFPILTEGVKILAQVSAFVERNGAVMKPLIVVVATLAAAFKAWTIIQAAWDAVMAANPISLVVIALAALAAGLIYAYNHSKTFRDTVQDAFAAVSAACSAMWGVIRTVFKFIIDTWFMVTGAIINGAASAFGWVPEIGGKLKSAAKEFNKFRDQVNAALGGVTKSVHVTVNADVALHETDQTGRSIGGVLTVGGRATGGSVVANMPYLVGENTPEMVVPNQAGRVLNMQQIAGMMGRPQNSGPEVIEIKQYLDGKQIHSTLLDLRRNRGQGLGLG